MCRARAPPGTADDHAEREPEQGRAGRQRVPPGECSDDATTGGEEIERFPEVPGPGDNGSPVPFDTPSNATFLGSRVLVANQSFTGDSSHHAILDVYVGEPVRVPYLPNTAYWR